MAVTLTVFAKNAEVARRLAEELDECVGDLAELSFLPPSELGQLVLVDESYPGLGEFLDGLEREGERKGRAVLLVVSESSGTEKPTEEFSSGRVDDFMVHPFRALEVLSKIRHAQQILMWDEVHEISASFSGMIERLREDLKFAERLQKSRLPSRFPDIQGFKIAHRYLAGMRSGGDHFDLLESKDRQRLSFVLSDSSSYGLSSSVLSTLMRVMALLSAEESRSCAETVARIQAELQSTLGPRDRLSLFYGVLSRKDYRLRYVNFGDSAAFYAPSGSAFASLGAQGQALTAATSAGGEQGRVLPAEAEIALGPGGRLALFSDGFVEAAGGTIALTSLLNEFRASRESGAAMDVLNELVFQVKRRLNGEDDMPAQDCTGAIFDLDARLIRLA